MSILTREKFPYIFVLILGLFVWSTSNFIEKGKSSPIVEYKILKNKDGLVKTRLRNISYDKGFKDIQFSICNQDHNDLDSIKAVTVKANPPYVQNIENVRDDGIDDECAIFTIENLQPGSTYFLYVEYSGVFVPEFFLHALGDQSIRLMKSSLLTWIFRNEFSIYIFFIIISLLFLGLYIFYLQQKKS